MSKFCPNLKLEPFRTVHRTRGIDAAYILNEVVSSPTFRDWKGDPELPEISEDGRLWNNSGETWNFYQYLEDLKDVKEEAYRDEFEERLEALRNNQRFMDLLDSFRRIARVEVTGESQSKSTEDFFNRILTSGAFRSKLKRNKSLWVAIEDLFRRDFGDDFSVLFSDYGYTLGTTVKGPDILERILGIKGSDTASLDDVIASVLASNPSQEISLMFKKLRPLMRRILSNRSTVQVVERIYVNKKGKLASQVFNRTSNGNFISKIQISRESIEFFEVFLDESQMSDQERKDKLATVLFHEIVHSISRTVLSADLDALNTSEREFRNRIETIYGELMAFMEDTGGKFTDEELNDMDLYGIRSIHEFTSELFSNPNFRKFVDQAVNITREGKHEKKTLWQKFIEALKNLLGLDTRSTRGTFSSQDEISRLLNLAKEFKVLNSNSIAFEDPLYARAFSEEELKGEVPPDSKRMALAKRVAQVYYQRIDELRWNQVHYNDDLESLQREISNIAGERKVTQDKIEQKQAEIVLHNFFKEAEKRFNRIRSDLDQGAEQLLTHRLKFYHKELNAYQPILEDIASLLQEDTLVQQIFTKDEAVRLNRIINEANNSREEILEEYHRKLINLMSPFALPLVMREFERREEKQFRKKNDHLTRAQASQLLEKHIPIYMAEHQSEIDEAVKKKIKDLLKYLPRDVSYLWRKTMPYHQSTDEIMQLSKLLLDKHAIDNTLREYWPLEKEFIEIFREFERDSGKVSNQKEFYKAILEVDSTGTFTQYFVQEYRMGEFRAIQRKLYAELDETIDSGKITELEAGKIRRLFFKDNFERRYTDEWYKKLDGIFGKPSKELEAINQRIANIIAVYHGENIDPQETSVDFLKSLKTLYEERNKILGKMGIKQRKALKAIADHPQTDEYQNALIKMQSDKKNGVITDDEYNLWYEATHVRMNPDNPKSSVPLPIFRKLVPKDLKRYSNSRYQEGKYTLKEKWLSRQYKDLMALPESNSTRKLYEYIMKRQAEFDRFRPIGRKLNGRLPGIRKKGWERTGEAQGAEGMWEMTKDELRRRKDDIEFGDPERLFRLDLEGETHRFIPIYYTGEIDEKHQSYDVATMFLANAEMTMRFQNLVEIAPDLEAARDLVKMRDVGTSIKRAGDEKNLAKAEANATEAFEVMLLDQLYGVHRQDKSNVKMWDTLQGYVSHLYLGAHAVASFQNLIYGQALNTVEAISGGYYKRKDLRKAFGQYSADMFEMWKDWTNATTDSRTHQLMLMFDAMKDFRGPRHVYSENTRLKRVIEPSTMLAFHTSGEHFIQGVNMYAMLNRVKIINENGEYINKDGTVVGSEKDAMTLADAYQKNDKGYVEINPMVKKIALDNRHMDWNEQNENFVRRRVHHMNTTIHGNYGHQAKSEIERYIMGRFALQLRKWMLQGARRRMAYSITKGKTSSDLPWWEKDITIADNELGDNFEGIFITALRFHRKLIRDMSWNPLTIMNGANRKAVVSAYRQLDDVEKASYLKSWFEVAVATVMSSFVVFILSHGFDLEEDDEEAKSWWRNVFYYTAYRMRIELALYYNPTALLDIVGSPAVVVSAAGALSEFGEQLLHDIWGVGTLQGMETYQTGSRAGQWKLRKKFQNLIPGVRAIQSLIHIKDKIAYSNLNR